MQLLRLIHPLRVTCKLNNQLRTLSMWIDRRTWISLVWCIILCMGLPQEPTCNIKARNLMDRTLQGLARWRATPIIQFTLRLRTKLESSPLLKELRPSMLPRLILPPRLSSSRLAKSSLLALSPTHRWITRDRHQTPAWWLVRSTCQEQFQTLIETSLSRVWIKE